MSIILANRLKNHINISVRDFLDLEDCKNDEEKILSRGLAAIALSGLSGLKYAELAKYITDGAKDNGIDAVYFDPTKNKLFLIQAKLSSKGTSTIGTGDIRKFVAGTYDLLNEEWSKFNIKFKAISTEISAGIRSDPEIVLVATYNSDNPISTDCQEIINDFLKDNNSDSQDVVSFEKFELKRLIRCIKSVKTGSKTDIEVNLLQWGEQSDPYYSIYGKVSCADIAQWYIEHGDFLFTENIRNTLTDSDINLQIESSLLKTPKEFWYLNNGITAIADAVKRKPIGMGEQRDSSYWKISNMKIVNGAQTTGSIYSAHEKNPKVTPLAYVQVKIISLADSPLDLAGKITTATNTQNKVEPKDFLALDELQDGLAEGFRKIGIQYCFRRGEKILDPTKGLDVQELAMTLAVTSDSMADVVISKRNVGSLTDPNGHYRKIFPQHINAKLSWEKVKKYRQVREHLERFTASQVGRNAQLAVHGNRFIEHMALEAGSTSVKQITSIHEKLHDAIQDLYPESYLAVLFKNAKKCEALKAKIII
ncbi:AIPR family protein [soil metagenome]